MAEKTYRFPVTVAVPDPTRTIPEVRDADGRLVRPASVEMKYILPGAAVKLDEGEGDRLLARFGEWAPPIPEKGPVTRTP